MFKNQPETLRFTELDGVVALVLIVLCVHPQGDQVGSRVSLGVMDCIFGVVFVLAWKYCFTTLNLYSKMAPLSSRTLAVFKGTVIMMTLAGVYLLAFHRSLVTAQALLKSAFVVAAYELCRIFLTSYLLDRLAARDSRHVIIVGSGKRASKAWRAIRTRYHSSIKVLGFVDDRSPDEMPFELASRFLGEVDDLDKLLLRQIVDLIVIAMPLRSCYATMQRAVEIAERIGVRVIYLGDIYSSSRPGTANNEVMFTELAPEQDNYLIRVVTKRVLDVVIASAALVLLAPILLVIAIVVKLTSPGPVLFKQQRYGHRRRLFTLYKFRSMVSDAEQRLSDLEHLNEATGPIFKMKNDPRITRVGQFLRRTSLDELPQLWNVLIGDMSLVGPRPMSIRDVSLFSDAALLRRFSVQAGMTGLWQVHGRSNLAFDDWVTFDTHYIDNWSLLLDCRILMRTISVVFRGSGAV